MAAVRLSWLLLALQCAAAGKTGQRGDTDANAAARSVGGAAVASVAAVGTGEQPATASADEKPVAEPSAAMGQKPPTAEPSAVPAAGEQAAVVGPTAAEPSAVPAAGQSAVVRPAAASSAVPAAAGGQSAVEQSAAAGQKAAAEAAAAQDEPAALHTVLHAEPAVRRRARHRDVEPAVLHDMHVVEPAVLHDMHVVEPAVLHDMHVVEPAVRRRVRHREPAALHEMHAALHEMHAALHEMHAVLHEESAVLHEEPAMRRRVLHREREPAVRHEPATLHDPAALAQKAAGVEQSAAVVAKAAAEPSVPTAAGGPAVVQSAAVGQKPSAVPAVAGGQSAAVHQHAAAEPVAQRVGAVEQSAVEQTAADQQRPTETAAAAGRSPEQPAAVRSTLTAQKAAVRRLATRQVTAMARTTVSGSAADGTRLRDAASCAEAAEPPSAFEAGGPVLGGAATAVAEEADTGPGRWKAGWRQWGRELPLLVPSALVAGTWEVPGQTAAALRAVSGPLHVVAAVGEQRAGVSTFLNAVVAAASGSPPSQPLTGFSTWNHSAPLSYTKRGLRGVLLDAATLPGAGSWGVDGAVLLVESEPVGMLGGNALNPEVPLSAASLLASQMLLLPGRTAEDWVERTCALASIARLFVAEAKLRQFTTVDWPAAWPETRVGVLGAADDKAASQRIGCWQEVMEVFGGADVRGVPPPLPGNATADQWQDVGGKGLGSVTRGYAAAAAGVAEWILAHPRPERDGVAALQLLRSVASSAQAVDVPTLPTAADAYSAHALATVANATGEWVSGQMLLYARHGRRDGEEGSDPLSHFTRLAPDVPPTSVELTAHFHSLCNAARKYLQLSGGSSAQKIDAAAQAVVGQLKLRLPEWERLRVSSVAEAVLIHETSAAAAVAALFGSLPIVRSPEELRADAAGAEAAARQKFAAPLRRHHTTEPYAAADARLRDVVASSAAAAAAQSSAAIAAALDALHGPAVRTLTARVKPPPVATTGFTARHEAAHADAMSQWERAAVQAVGDWVQGTAEFVSARGALAEALATVMAESEASNDALIRNQCQQRVDAARDYFRRRLEATELTDPESVAKRATAAMAAAVALLKETLDTFSGSRWADQAAADFNRTLRAAIETEVLPAARQRWEKATSDAIACAEGSSDSAGVEPPLPRPVGWDTALESASWHCALSQEHVMNVFWRRAQECLKRADANVATASAQRLLHEWLSTPEMQQRTSEIALLDVGYWGQKALLCTPPMLLALTVHVVIRAC
eukprot:TRINITY_DN4113_c0_g1_i13.p1 TRINITY_DN4113_c0_g1~~TRINITY_DN4113_c0_g1_i13.p1  ORF type:complete len:1288 (+),score=345.60 TRINITY_DN4113_c0_g1_i13:87-3866(+)